MMGFVLPEQSAAPCVSSMHLLGERDTQREKNTEKKERQKDRQKKRKEERKSERWSRNDDGLFD